MGTGRSHKPQTGAQVGAETGQENTSKKRKELSEADKDRTSGPHSKRRRKQNNEEQINAFRELQGMQLNVEIRMMYARLIAQQERIAQFEQEDALKAKLEHAKAYDEVSRLEREMQDRLTQLERERSERLKALEESISKMLDDIKKLNVRLKELHVEAAEMDKKIVDDIKEVYKDVKPFSFEIDLSGLIEEIPELATIMAGDLAKAIQLAAEDIGDAIEEAIPDFIKNVIKEPEKSFEEHVSELDENVVVKCIDQAIRKILAPFVGDDEPKMQRCLDICHEEPKVQEFMAKAKQEMKANRNAQGKNAFKDLYTDLTERRRIEGDIESAKAEKEEIEATKKAAMSDKKSIGGVHEMGANRLQLKTKKANADDAFSTNDRKERTIKFMDRLSNNLKVNSVTSSPIQKKPKKQKSKGIDNAFEKLSRKPTV